MRAITAIIIIALLIGLINHSALLNQQQVVAEPTSELTDIGCGWGLWIVLDCILESQVGGVEKGYTGHRIGLLSALPGGLFAVGKQIQQPAPCGQSTRIQ